VEYRTRGPAASQGVRTRCDEGIFPFCVTAGQRYELANIGYEEIETRTGVKRVRTKAATNFLACLSLIYVERLASQSTGCIKRIYDDVFSMSLQNRVDPFGNLTRTPARGMIMGNRGGVLHANREIVRLY
jgi:hypothetical protein